MSPQVRQRRNTVYASGWAIIIASALGLAFSNAAANQVPLCPEEDSIGCYWDAQRQGNGVGQSFVVDNEGNVTYVD